MSIVILITTKDKEQAETIANQLVVDKLVACVNVVSGVESIFWWEEKVNKEKECLLVCKTNKEMFSKIVPVVKSLHTYTVPEIIALPIVDGNEDYLKWIDESVTG